MPTSDRLLFTGLASLLVVLRILGVLLQLFNDDFVASLEEGQVVSLSLALSCILCAVLQTLPQPLVCPSDPLQVVTVPVASLPHRLHSLFTVRQLFPQRLQVLPPSSRRRCFSRARACPRLFQFCAYLLQVLLHFLL